MKRNLVQTFCLVLALALCFSCTAFPQQSDSPIADWAPGAYAGLDTAQIAYIEQAAASLKMPLAMDLPAANGDMAETVEILVEFDELPLALARRYNEAHRLPAPQEAAYDARHAAFLETLESMGVPYGVLYSYSEVFFGVSLTVPFDALDQVASIEGVRAVYGSVEYSTGIWQKTDTLASGEGGMAESRAALRIDELRELGYAGKGVKVAVIDTGCDYNHPDLKAAYRGGYDFVDNDSDPMEATYDDWKKSGQPELSSSGSPYYTSHGTHVSGTIAASGAASGGFSSLGMAPEVDLYAFRVLGPYGTGSSANVIAAIEEVASPGRDGLVMDVANLSLGTATNTAYTPTNTACNNATIAGTLIVVAAGNEGMPAGAASRQANTLGSPGTAYLPISVAASRYGGPRQTIYADATLGDGTPFAFNVLGMSFSDLYLDGEIVTGTLVASESGTYPIKAVFGAGSSATSLKPTTLTQLADLPGGSLSNTVLAVKRGSVAFTDFLSQARRLDAGALLIVNSDNEEMLGSVNIGGEHADYIPILSSSANDGLALFGKDALEIEVGKVSGLDQPKVPADFSSVGPVRETYGVKPDVITPGFEIMSTVPPYIANADRNSKDYMYSYDRMSGTSMATPHMTGVAALFIQRFPDASPAEIKARIMNTADPMLILAGTGAPAGRDSSSVFEAGAGFPDPYRGIVEDTATYITVTDSVPGNSASSPIANQSVASMNFGVVERSATETRSLEVVIHNTSKTDREYAFEYLANDRTPFSLDGSAYGLGLSFSQETLVVQAGGQGTVKVKCTFSSALAAGRLEGYMIVIDGDNGYVIPFGMGVK